MHTAIMHAVASFDAVDYLQRATDVVDKVCAALPEIRDLAADLPQQLTKARNEMAHQPPLRHDLEPLDVRYRRWMVVAAVTPWLLRGLLLLEAGVDPGVLHERSMGNMRFVYFLANVRQLAAELGWDASSER